MIKENQMAAREEARRILGYIEAQELTDEEKVRITRDSIENFANNVNPGWLEYRKSVSTDSACIEWSDTEENFKDLYGNEFIDFLGGFGIYTCGHRNPYILKYVKAQLDRYALHSQELIDPLRGYLSKLMSMITPGDLQYCFFTNGGAEAMEMALKLARLATGGSWYISTHGAFHGKSMGALSVCGKDAYRLDYMPLIQQVSHVPFGDAEAMEAEVQRILGEGHALAGIVIEPIQGEAGVNIPPEGYLRAIREICDKYNIAMIVDEIQTGMGRTGTLWRCDAEDVTPDIMAYGKAFGGGIMPITGIIARPSMWPDKIRENPWILGSPTFGGNPLACSAAIAAISYTLENDIPRHAKEKGEFLMGYLRSFAEKYPEVLVDVRGAGLLIALEFPNSEIGYAVTKELFKRNVMTAGTLVNAKTVRIEPAAISSYETLKTGMERLEEALIAVKNTLNQ